MADTKKATPGPWAAVETRRDVVEIHGAPGTYVVARVPFVGGDSEARANALADATLIVEAVNAYDALKAQNAELVEAIEDYCERHEGGDEVTRFRAALAKVKP
jgi:hypothetical protein